VDPFALVLLAGLAALILWVWLLGKYYPGSGMEQLGLRTAREISENREALDAEDLEHARAPLALTDTDVEQITTLTARPAGAHTANATPATPSSSRTCAPRRE